MTEDVTDGLDMIKCLQHPQWLINGWSSSPSVTYQRQHHQIAINCLRALIAVHHPLSIVAGPHYVECLTVA